MKIIELDSTKFDQIVSREPLANFKQESSYVKNITDYTVKYLGFSDDEKIYNVLGLFLIKKGSLFKRNGIAICDNGFLTNYYDIDLLKEFTLKLSEYFKNYYISSMEITPPIEYQSKNGNNELLIKRLQEIGYTKIDDNYLYCKKIDKDNLEIEDFEDFYLEVSKKDNVLDITINTKKTVQALNTSINECNDYISKHNDDYKLFDEIAAKQEIIKTKQSYISLLNTLTTNTLGHCEYDLYNEGFYLRKFNYNPNFDFIGISDTLKKSIYLCALENKQNYVFSDFAFDDATKIDFIGKFEYKF